MEQEHQSESPIPALELKERRRKKLRRIILILGLVSVVACVWAYRHYQAFESTDDAFIDGRYAVISSRVPGCVAAIHVKDNQWVTAGDLLLELDPSDYKVRLDAASAVLSAAKAAARAKSLDVTVTDMTTQAHLNEAKAGLESATAAVESARAQLDLAVNSLDLAQAEVTSARAVHDRDTVDLSRYREMAEVKVVSQQSFDHMIAAEAMSAAKLIAAEKNVATRKAMIKQAEASLKASESNRLQALARLASAKSAPEKVEQSKSHSDISAADVKRAESEVAQARLNLSYTRITAPVDGYVTRKNIAMGQLIQTGQSLLSIVPKDIWVTANFKETQIADMQPGLFVEIRVDSYPDFTFTGRVDSLQRGTGSLFSLLPPENATGNFVKVVQRIPVKITLDPDPRLDKLILTPGMSVITDVHLTSDKVLAPSRMVSKKPEPIKAKDGV